jgi:sulfur-oxidizing protein SoxX
MIRATAIVTAVLAVTAAGALADETAPQDVKFEDLAVAASLTGKPGDPAVGRDIFKDRKLGNCLACHTNADMQKELFHGTVGPAMDGAGDRWEPAQLRAIITDAKQVFGEQTVMPGFYSLAVGKDVREDLVGKTILTAQQIEDVVAYVATLKE